MRSRVVTAMAKIKNNGWIDVLQECPGLKGRYKKLAELLPEIRDWSPLIVRQQLIFHLQHVLKIEFGVCEYYLIDDHRQHCLFDGEKTECLCLIPQSFCIFRDRDGKPKYPEFL